MTDTIEPKMSEGFAFSAGADAPHDLELSAEVDDMILSVESVVAAMMSNKHNLSADELAAFEELLDAPDVDPKKRQKLLQTLWNIVVCLIDYQWENAPLLTSQNSCGSIPYEGNELTSDTSGMVKSSDHNLAQNNIEAAADTPGQEGSP